MSRSTPDPSCLHQDTAAWELDHVFICAQPGDATLLENRGLRSGGSGAHRGQGTAGAWFFFDNAYVELLWSVDVALLRSERVRALSLFERLHWRTSGASPFGVALRPTVRGQPTPAAWRYQAPFLSGEDSLPILIPRDQPNQPLFFISPEATAPADHKPERPAVDPRGRIRMLTAVTLFTPRGTPLPPLPRVTGAATLTMKEASQWHLVVEVNGGEDGRTDDFTPTLPLAILW